MGMRTTKKLVLICSTIVIGCGGGGDDNASGDLDSGLNADSTTGDSVSADDSTIPEGAPLDTSVPLADAPWDTKLPPTPDKPQLWYWHHTYLSAGNAAEPAASKARIDTAVSAGYTGLALWDSSQSFVQRPGWDSSKLKDVVSYATSKGLKVLPLTAPFGYSNDLLQDDPNLAEGQRVVGPKFKVTAGKLVLQNSLPPPVNGDFESGTSGWFGIGDARVSRDTSVHHGGAASAHIGGSATASDNARLMQKITVIPWRLYHLRLWMKTAALARNKPTLNIFDLDLTGNPSRYYQDLDLTGTHDWTQIDVTLNSGESKTLGVYIGMWGGNSGDLWVDDIVMEETALVNLLRRDGTPLKVYDDTTTYVEGTDYDKIVDPKLVRSPGNYDVWHDPPVASVTPGGKLKEGMVVSVDHYTVIPIYGFEVGACLTEPAVQDWEKKNLAALDAIFPKDSGFFLQYDEMRHMHSCAKCKAAKGTAGELLAWHVGLTTDAVFALRPAAPVYVWNDMFDPTHNAHDNYFNVEGDIAGSWAGLRPGTIVMNWLRKPESLKFFSGTDPKQPHPFQQILAGYYDSGDGKGAANADLAAAKGVPGIIGAMYTAWTDDYSQLAQYAQAMKDGWAGYKASVP